jgi:ABC-type nitrate/sulfonate/bicarbonate transport system permease component
MAKAAISLTARRERRTYPALVTWTRRIAFYIALAALWQLIVYTGIWPDYVLPGPLEVASTLVGGIASGVYLQAAAVSLYLSCCLPLCLLSWKVSSRARRSPGAC